MNNNKFIVTNRLENYILATISISIIFLIAAVSCKKGNNTAPNSVYITQATHSSITTLALDETGSTAIDIVSTYAVNQNVDVSVEVDSSYLKAYNQENGTNYVMFPQSAFSLSSNTAAIKNGSAIVKPITINAKSFSAFDYSLQYAIPLKIAATSNTMPSIARESVIIVAIAKTIHFTASIVADNNSGTAQGYKFNNTKLFGASGSTTVIPNYTIEGRFMVSKNLNGGTRWFYSLFEGANGVFFVLRNGSNGGDVRDAGGLTITSYYYD